VNVKRPVWTHPSVTQIAEGRDPVAVISEKARAVVLQAFDAGWKGPPFDPFQLADLLHIEAVPRQGLSDACTVPVGRDRVRIEYNPARPRGRLRYSIAHEIAHTLFPDCAEQVRHRVNRAAMVGDEWQLEALCNIAAAEFLMPMGSFPDLREEDLRLDRLLELRREYDVSAEALLIRAGRLAEHPCAIFAVSRIESGEAAGRYRVEYGIASAGWTDDIRSGALLPSPSVAAQCTAIGFTAIGKERWPGWKKLHQVECVGLPPYKGSRHPRVAGVAVAGDISIPRLLQYLAGDATKPRKRPAVVAHVVNNATPNWGGRGFARAVRTAWPHVQDGFRRWAEETQPRLGNLHTTQAEQGIWVGSIVAQRGYGPSTTPRIRYTALREGLSCMANFAVTHNATIHMPRIGCGEGGGDWILVEELIRTELISRGLEVTVYDLPGASRRLPEQPSLKLIVS
jgi:uncharacterized protein DUF955